MTLLDLYLAASDRTAISPPNRSVLRTLAPIFDVENELEEIDLHIVATTDLREPEALIETTRQRARPNRPALRPGPMRNYRAMLKSLVQHAIVMTGREQPTALSNHTPNMRLGVTHRKRVDLTALSLDAQREAEAWVQWKTASTLPPRESSYRKLTWRPDTAADVSRRVRSMWVRLERQLGRPSTRAERFSPTQFQRVANAYIEEAETPADNGKTRYAGYSVLRQVAAHLEIGCREYLPAIDPDALEALREEVSGEPADAFAAYKDTYQRLAARPTPGDVKVDVTGWTRKDVWDVGMRAIAEASKIAEKRGARWRESELRYRRGGLATIILASWPFRIRNLGIMKWDEHLYFNDGVWAFHFEGEELKVPFRGKELNVHAGTFNAPISKEITRWRDFLEGRYGRDVVRDAAYVFPTHEDLKQAAAKHQGAPPEAHEWLARARDWLHMTPEVRQRRAVRAAEVRDVDDLWGLTLAQSDLRHGRAVRSFGILQRDLHTLRTVLDSECFSPLLAPPEDALLAFEANQVEDGFRRQTIEARRVLVKNLFAALRWVGGTSADPLHGFVTSERTGAYTANRASARHRLRHDFKALFLEYRGAHITPHRVRNIVLNDAKSFGQRTGEDAFALGAHRLGNSVYTVIRNYNLMDLSADRNFDEELTTGTDTVETPDTQPTQLEALLETLTAQEKAQLRTLLEAT